MVAGKGQLFGRKIDINRAHTWLWPSATRAVRQEDLMEFAPIVQHPRMGDVVLAQVEEINKYDFMEVLSGCNMNIFVGTIFVGVMSTRYAPNEYEGIVPEKMPEDDIISMLNRGGTLGQILSKNSGISSPTKVKVLANLKYRNGEIVNTTQALASFNSSPSLYAGTNRKLIVVLGSLMDAGKTNGAKAVVYALTAAGHNVVAGKVTGTAAQKDVLLMKAAGASFITDFASIGYPATYMLTEQDTKDLFWRIYNLLCDNSDDGDYIVIELADGILQRENEILLTDKEIKNKIDKVVFACGDALSAKAGMDILRERYNIKVDAITGRVANSELSMKEFTQISGDLPWFNAMEIDIDRILKIVE